MKKMKLKELCSYLDTEVPLSLQESYDNSGLQVGLPDKDIKKALITLDVTEEVMDEAEALKCDMIISHHPLLFAGLKKIDGSTYTDRILSRAIKHDIAIYSAHTNLDNIMNGVSRKMAEKLNLKEIKVLSPGDRGLVKLVTYIPEAHLDKVRNALFEAGAGVIGKYDSCGFESPGRGSFRGDETSNPFTGEKGKMHYENEIRFETVMFAHLKEKVLKALINNHPYEEVAYDIYSLDNPVSEMGLGCVGELAEEMEERDFLKHISSVFMAQGIRYSKLAGRNVKRIALCGGSGASLLNSAINTRADVFITSDIKYHTFFDADSKILLIDIGHFESENFSSEILYNLIIKKFPKFAVRFSETYTNPINYL